MNLLMKSCSIHYSKELFLEKPFEESETNLASLSRIKSISGMSAPRCCCCRHRSVAAGMFPWSEVVVHWELLALSAVALTLFCALALALWRLAHRAGRDLGVDSHGRAYVIVDL